MSVGLFIKQKKFIEAELKKGKVVKEVRVDPINLFDLEVNFMGKTYPEIFYGR